MSSKIKVDTIENVAGSGNVSLGSGHNLVVPGNITGQGTLGVTGASTLTGNVGIGNARTEGTLHIHTGSAGTVSASTQADDLVVENSVETGITIISPDDQSARIRFTSPSTNTDVGGATIFYRQNINKMNVGTAVAGGVLDLLSGAGVSAIKADANGRVTMSLQPSFAVYGVNNNTGFNMIDATEVKLVNWQSAYHNTGSHFNTTTGVFTAPVAGKYFFYLNLMFRMDLSTYINDLVFKFKKNGADYITTDIGYNGDTNGDRWNTETVSSIISLNPNDTVDAHYFLASSSHSTGAATNWYMYNGVYTQFHGHFLG